jgi:hypothetical protein
MIIFCASTAVFFCQKRQYFFPFFAKIFTNFNLWPQISDAMNEYAVSHQQDLLLTSLPHKPLTEPTLVSSIDFRLDSPELHSVSVAAKVIAAGTAHALIYWLIHLYNPIPEWKLSAVQK